MTQLDLHWMSLAYKAVVVLMRTAHRCEITASSSEYECDVRSCSKVYMLSSLREKLRFKKVATCWDTELRGPYMNEPFGRTYHFYL